ncbi:ABC transporter ATP-binding protein [uncultured Sphingomonas sp.]|uniref:nickel ABC transporter ATP-binding protein NikE n=1 Tax=uncultured Sphingomonas sp. TaxID=158754 RepID=UPI0025FF5852|nr:ABC transporter ATP-binding protein [uncultured Sphingomonas sp.]
MTLLSFEKLSLCYDGRAVLRDVSLAVGAGEIVALVGRSGSGKSSLAHALLGLLPDGARIGGRMLLDGEDLAVLDERRFSQVRGGRIGMVFQEPATALNPALTIGRQIEEVLARHTALDRAARRQAATTLLAQMGLDVAPSRHPHSLSGGQRQRVAIAMALAGEPALLVADEPTASLDPLAQAKVIEVLVQAVRERGMGLLLATHDLPLATNIADRLVVLEDGQVAEQGPPATLIRQPASAFLRASVTAATPPPAPPPSLRSEPIVGIEGVSCSFRKPGLVARGRLPALSCITAALHRGETLAVIGPSGSGKSTLARLVLGLDRAEQGVITIGGQDWRHARGASLRAMRRRVQAVFQDPAASFDPAWTVARIVGEPLRLAATPPSDAERTAMVVETLGQVGLEADAAMRLPRHFSGGQRQRIAIARALILRPNVVVLDEAFTALDPPLKAEMAALLQRLQSDLGLAFLFVSHDLALVRGLAHRVIVLKDGEIVEQGDAAQVLAAPLHPYTAALLAATPEVRRSGLGPKD